jgi:hypothetical protein
VLCLYAQNVWIPLTRASIDAFSFSDILNKTLTIADRRNLPSSLKHYGAVPCRLDYTVPGERKEQVLLVDGVPTRFDEKQVPIGLFMDRNKWAIDESVASVRTVLIDARKSGQETRALLCFDDKEQVEVLADRQVILDGADGEEHMKLTVQAWGQALPIITPILAVMIICSYFTSVIRTLINSADAGTTDYTVRPHT